MRVLSCLLLLFLGYFGNSQSLKNGPMLGYLALREASVWVQTTEASTVQLRYWEVANPLKKELSEPITTNKAHTFTATLAAGPLNLGSSYQYEVLVNGRAIPSKGNQTFKTRSLWKWRTDAPDFSFLTGSCNYINDSLYDRPGKPYGSNFQIFESMAKDTGAFMVWLGDNNYLREPDWDSKSGIQYRYTHGRALPEMQNFLRNKHHYAIWDDHDYGPNDSERSYYFKDFALQTFKDFWPNPNWGAGDTEGITGFFDWSDCDFYMMDDRWYRTPQGQSGLMLGEKQLTWLIESLKGSYAKYKFVAVGSQVLNSSMSKENHIQFTKERKRLIEALDENNIKGVIFLTGDRHHSEVSKFTTEDGDVFYDLTISPLTSGHATKVDEINTNRVEGSLITQHNYAVISVQGKGKERKVIVTYKDSNGNKIKEHTISN